MSNEIPEPGRRRWLRDLIPRGVDLVAKPIAREIERRLPSRRRPPGAVPEALFLAGCTRCLACVDACPHRAIYTLAPSVGLAADTPVMVPDQRACHMCEGFPCAIACPEQVLIPPTEPAWRLGFVRIDSARCLPFMGPECGACGDTCPDGVDALRLRLGRPVIDTDACVGCGLCIAACITQPPAITLAPLGDRHAES